MKLIRATLSLLFILIFIRVFSQSPGSGYAIDFDGSNDKVTIPYTSAISGLTTELTIEFWVKPTSASISASFAGLVCKYYTAADASNSFVCDMQSGVFKFMIRESDNTEVWLNTSYTATADTWYHVAFTADGSNLKAYINGVQQGSSVSYDGTIEQASRITTIGTYRNDDTWGVADVTMDEVRIWKKGLSQTTIRDWMCRKVTSSHTNYSDLNSYYKFDENTGSTAYDSSGTNNGTLTNSPAYVLSGAAIGNESTHSYGSGNSTSVTETHSDGSSFKIDNFTGTPDGAHVYLVTASPNSTTESLSGALESTRYYGTFVVGGTSPTHSVTYDYTGNTNITGGTESQAVLAYRAENATSSWTQLTTSFDLNTSTDVIAQCNVSTSQEYAGGFDAVLQERPGSGYALSFDGTNDYVDVGDLGLSSGTICMWIKATNDVDDLRLWSHLTGATTQAGAVGIGLSDYDVQVWSGTTWLTLVDNSASVAGDWHHLAVVYSGGSATGYWDGIQKSTVTTNFDFNGVSMGLGADYILTHGDTYDGKMDEVSIWSTSLTTAEIQSLMTQKITSAHSKYCNLKSYYRFDENTGSTLVDYAGSNNGTLTNSPTYELSGAPIGDESTSSYGSGNSTSVTETHSDGSSFKIDNFTGTPDGAHVYLVNESPNSTTESLSGALESTRYYGTFVVGGTSPTHTVTHDYTGNTNITGGTESETKLTTRSDNSGTSWTTYSSYFDLDEASNTISKCGQTANNEYAAGFDNSILQERPGSGYALTFDGTNDYIDLGDNIEGLSAITIEAWIYNQGNNTWNEISSKQHVNAFSLNATNDKLWFHLGDGSAWFAGGGLASNSTIPENIWTHVAVTWDGTTAKMYINGVLDLSSAHTGTMGSNSNSRGIGDRPGGTSLSFKGKMDEFRIWSTALTQTEIQNWMCQKVNSSHTNYCSLAAYYRFDENTGTTLYDYTGNVNGTLTNGPTYALSGAAIGDESTNSYGSGNSTSVTETHADGSSFKVDNFTGTPDGAHVYLVNESPNSTTESLSGALESTRYYGTFVVGGTSPTHTVTHDYTGNTNITGGSESQAVLAYRAENATSSWTQLTNSFDLNTSTDVITQCNVSTSQEYAGGFDAVLQERPGSGYALDFDGSNDYISISDNDNLSFGDGTSDQAFSVEAWINLDATASQMILSKRVGGNDEYQFGTSSGGALSIALADESSSGFIFGETAALSLNTGQWYHVAFTYSGSGTNSGIKIYLNGVLQTNTLPSGSGTYTAMENTSSAVQIGTFNSSTSNNFNGEIDEVKIWNTALSQTEIRDWMCKKVTNSHSKFCNLVSYYRFDENTGTTLIDYAGENNGTLTNGPTYVLSGAPTGDESTYTYGSGNSTSVTETHTDGSSFKIDNFSGTPDGAHVYLVNETPNSTTESLSGALESTRYYGTFVVGGTSPTHSVTYDYSGNSNVTGGTESETKLTTRADNSGTSWTSYSSYFDLDEANNKISKCGQSANKEYAAGFDNTTLQERPGSGYSLDFDGTNDYVTIPHTASQIGMTELTIEAWVYRDVSGAYHNVLLKGNYGYGLIVDNSNKLGYWSNASYGSCPNAGTVPNSEWTHLAVTVVQNSLTTFYINGINVGSSSTAGHTTINDGSSLDLIIGKQGTVSGNYFNGKIDEIKVWNKALSQTEIQTWMCKKVTSSHPKYCNLISYYRFDENTGTSLTDYTGGSNGTLTNSPTYALSGAPVGDNAAFATTVTSSTTLSLAHADGPQMNVDVTSGTADLIAVYRVDEAPNVTTAPSGLTEVSASHYYGVKAFGSSSLVYEVSYNYNGHLDLDASEEDSLKLCSRADNSTSSWTLQSATLNTTSNTLTLGGQTGTQFIMGSSNPGVLPIELSQFNVNRNNDIVEVSWTTESEINNDYFEVQRSSNGSDWKSLERITGAGNSSSQISYGTLDESPLEGISYYRLKQVDRDGSSSYSDVVRIDFNSASNHNFKIYPNPASGFVLIEGEIGDLNQVKVYNTLGENLSQETIMKVIDETKLNIDLSKLESGIYILHVGENKYKLYKK